MSKIIAIDLQQDSKNELANAMYELRLVQQQIKDFQDKEKKLKDFLKTQEFDQISIINNNGVDILKISQYETNRTTIDTKGVLEDLKANFEDHKLLEHIFEKNTTTKEIKNIRFTFSREE